MGLKIVPGILKKSLSLHLLLFQVVSVKKGILYTGLEGTVL